MHVLWPVADDREQQHQSDDDQGRGGEVHGGPHLGWLEVCTPFSVWIQIAGSTVMRNVLPQWRQVRLSPSDQVAWLPRLERFAGVLIV
jgi:hypothetical protein